jgi:hypothetical protein
LLALLVLALPAAYVAKTAVPLIRSPEHWPLKGRWIVWGRKPRHPRPRNAEVRFWAVVWTGIALLWVAVGAAILFTSG